MLNNRIQELKQLIIEYAALVESMIDKSVRAISTKDAKILQAIIEVDEPKANQFDLRMDEACISTIAQYQPRARDLRTIIMILKMSNDFIPQIIHNVIPSADCLRRFNIFINKGINAVMQHPKGFLRQPVHLRNRLESGLLDQVKPILADFYCSIA